MRLVTKEYPLSLFLKFPETMCLVLDEAFFSVIYYGKNGGRAVPYQEMKLRTKLMISFAAIIVVPLALMLLFVSAYMNMKVRSLEKEYEIELTLPDMINTAQMINESTAKLLEQMKRDTGSDPERILDIGYLQDIDNELGGRLSFLVVMLDGEVYYAQNRNNLGELMEVLPPQGSGNADKNPEGGVYVSGENPAMVKQLDITLRDGSAASAYIITTVTGVLPEFRTMTRQLVMVMILILLITATILTVWIHKGITSPIRDLRIATHRIADGDLDFTLETDRSDEFGDLTRDFEKMRTRLAQAEEEKRRYDDQSRELISNISHDLKTPLTTIKGYVEGIMDGVADTPEKMDHYVKTIYSKANEMDRLVNELSLYSKIDTNKLPYHFTLLNVKGFFDDCAEEMDIELKERDVTFYYENRVMEDTMIIADPEQLRRVISNIMSNSIKYMDKKPAVIRLEVEDEGDFIRVDIEDNGPGIEGRELERIFDRFYRTDESRNSAMGGSGIGLSIVRKIIEDHSGRIWATSRVGEGTVMHFVIRKYQEVPV